MANQPIHFYVAEDLDKDTLDRHVQQDLDHGATVCVHFHKRHEHCSNTCETREPDVLHRNVFDQTPTQ